MFRKSAFTFLWRIHSIPIFLKILGIGFLVAILFGGVTLVQTRASTSHILYLMLEQRTLTAVRALADALEEPASTGDLIAVMQQVKEAKETSPEVRYIIVRDTEGKIIGSTFEKGIPPDLSNVSSLPDPAEYRIVTLDSGEGPIFDVCYPISGGHVGTVEMGVLDRTVSRELSAVTRTVLWGLLLCVSVGACLALLLTHILTRPIHHLVQSANRIREGKFETRASVFSNDEIGRLAVAFNQMAEALMRYRQEVQAKEKARLSLIERIVQAQEDERKSISRELHDHFGQSLLALLLHVQSGCKYTPAKCEYKRHSGSLCTDLEETILKLIEDVHRLAWGMRPSILDDYGLDSALGRHIEEISKDSGLEVDYQFTCPPGLERLPSRIEVTIFRIAQEAITNVLRHANASRVSVTIVRQMRDIMLLVEDDGRGFDPAVIREKGDKCLGLVGMDERVALLGGSFVVESAPGEGTTIHVRIPLSEDRDVDTNFDR